jgi:O-antigen/teichoic acid export membrane protein
MALIVQSLMNNLVNTVLIWLMVIWKFSLKFSYERFVGLFNYAYKLTLARLVNSVFNEIYSIVIGKAYTPAQLGFFNRAKSFTELSSGNITSIVQKVSVPLLCEAQHDNKRMGEVLLKFIKNTAFIVFPLLCGLFVLAEPLVSILLTDKWLPSVWILRVLCPVGMMFVISTFNMNVFNATGRTDWALKSEIIKKIIYVGIIAIAVFFGFEALIYSQILIAIIELIISTYYTKKQIGLKLFCQLTSLSSIFFLSIIMAIIVWSVTCMLPNMYYKLFIGILVGVISYTVLVYFLNTNNFRDVLKNAILKKK